MKPRLPSSGPRRRATLLALLVLVALPAVLLWEPLFRGFDYLPFDSTTFPPLSCALDQAEIDNRKAGSNWDITEKSQVCAPEYRLARAEIEEGRFPHWNPYVRAGAPLFATAVSGFAQPLHWFFLAFDPNRAFGFVAWIAFTLAGVFMFGFLREIGLCIGPALFGAVVFQLSGTLAANGHFYMRMETLLWLPAGFWALERLSKQRGVARIPALCGLAVSLGLCWLSGFPPYALAISFAFGLYVLVLALRALRGEGTGSAVALGAWFGCAVLCAIGLAAVQLVPMLDHFPNTERDLNQTTANLTAQGFDPAGLLGFFMSAPFGSGIESPELPYSKNPLIHMLWSRADPATGKLHFPINFNYTEYAIWLGSLPLVCMFLALFRPTVRFRYFAVSALLLFAALATGGVAYGLVGWFPAFQASSPFRMMAPVCFFGAALAAMGLEVAPTLTRRLRGVAIAVPSAFAVACTAVWLYTASIASDGAGAIRWMTDGIAKGWMSSYPDVAGNAKTLEGLFGSTTVPALQHMSDQAGIAALCFVAITVWLVLLQSRRIGNMRTMLPWLAIGLTALELVLGARHINPSFPHRNEPDTPVHRFLREQRVAHRESGGFMVARVGSTPTAPTALPPNLLIPEGIRDLNCYQWVDKRSWRPFRELYGPSQMLREYWVRTLPADDRLQRGLFDLFGVRYLLSNEEIPKLGPPATKPLIGPSGGFWIYERKTALPRAFLVPEAEVVGDDDTAVQRLIAKDFDPRARVLLQPSTAIAHLDAMADPTKIAAAKVRFLEDTTSELRLLIDDCPGAWLVLTDTALPHWHTTIDDNKADWHRANLCFRALWIPPGKHDVRFVYSTSPFIRGLLLTAFSAAVLIIALCWWYGHQTRRDPHVVDTETPFGESSPT